MKRKIIECIVMSVIGLCLTRPKDAEREVIEVEWDLTYYEEAPEAPAEEQYNRDLLARVCMSEAGNEPLVGKIAVVTTILNRCDMFGQTVEQVVYAPNQYCTKNNGAPTEEVYLAVDMALANRDLYPADMLYFRTKHFHRFGQPYAVIGSHYFSTKGEN